MKPKLVAIIPVLGREYLLPLTINRLYNVNKLFKVICCGHLEKDKKICEDSGAEWVHVKNNPLGYKWNKGFKLAKKYNPDGVLFVGSSDWVDRKWINKAWKYLENDEYAMIGKKDFSMVDISKTGEKRFCKWLGYTDELRKQEPIGIGRIITRKFLESIDYEPFLSSASKSMDFYMWEKCLNKGFKVKLLDDNSIFLSVSTNLWINKHLFNRHYTSVILDEKTFTILEEELINNIISNLKKKRRLKFTIALSLYKTLIYLYYSEHFSCYRDTTRLIDNNEEYEKEFPEINLFKNIINNVTKNIVLEKKEKNKNIENFFVHKYLYINYWEKYNVLYILNILNHSLISEELKKEKKFNFNILFVDELIYKFIKNQEDKNIVNKFIDEIFYIINHKN